MNDQRLERLLDLVELRVQLNDAIERLRPFPWDSETPILVLTGTHLTSAIDRYLAGDLSAEELAGWADAVEVRDDIGRESGIEDALNEFLFEVSAPEINGQLTLERARHWLVLLQQSA